MYTRKLALAAALLASTCAHAQFGMGAMMNPMTMGMMNPAMMMAPMSMGMMNPVTMMAPGGIAGMNPAQYISNPYLNPTSTLMPFLGSPVAVGNPYLMPAPQPKAGGFGSFGGMGMNPYLAPPPPPKQQPGLFPFLPVQPAPASSGQAAPQTGFFPMTPSAAAPAPAVVYGYGIPAYMPAQPPAPAKTPAAGAFMPFFPATPASQPAQPAATPKTAHQPAAVAPAANMFDAAAWAQMFPNSVPPTMQAQPATPVPAAPPAAPVAPQPASGAAPNYFDPAMWMQWMAPAAPK